MFSGKLIQFNNSLSE